MKRIPLLVLLAFAQLGCARVHSAPQPVSPGNLFLAFGCVVIVGIMANAYLVSLVRADHPEGSIRAPGWQGMLEFSSLTLGGFSWRNLGLWSFLSLFLELLMIRWISSEILIFAYFKNFVLIACFLGFGLLLSFTSQDQSPIFVLIPMTVLTRSSTALGGN